MRFPEEFSDKVRLTLALAQVVSGHPFAFGFVLRRCTSDGVLLEIVIQELIRIQFRAVRREKCTFDPIGVCCDPCRDTYVSG